MGELIVLLNTEDMPPEKVRVRRWVESGETLCVDGVVVGVQVDRIDDAYMPVLLVDAPTLGYLPRPVPVSTLLPMVYGELRIIPRAMAIDVFNRPVRILVEFTRIKKSQRHTG